jgi:hypothetical protein
VTSKAKANFAGVMAIRSMLAGTHPEHGGGQQFGDFQVRVPGLDFRRRATDCGGEFGC